MPSAAIQIEIDAARTTFQIHETELRRLLSVHGPIGADIARRAIRVESAAKRNASEPHRAGPYSGSAVGAGPAVRTGRLRGSITWRLGEDFLGVFADIGSAVLYAAYVELGTRYMASRPYLVPALEHAR